MSRSRTKRQELPVETSWRMVEGENDSFDTSLIPPDDLFDDEDIVPSSGPSQLSNLSNLSQLSQLSSQSNGDWRIGGSQDNSTIHDFISKADDERVIMRSPFAPSVPGASRRSPRQQQADYSAARSPEPEFYMPRVDVDSPRRASSSASTRTVRPGDEQNVRRRTRLNNTAQANGASPPMSLFAKPAEPERPNMGQRISSDIPHALYDILGWAFGVLGMAFRYTQKPLALALALYLVVGALILASNWLTRSVYVALSPVCNIPGLTTIVDLPFCAKGPDDNARPLEFESVMSVEAAFEQLYEKSASGVSLPIEMKRSEIAVRDLRTMVKYSDLQGKEDLVAQFTGFINAASKASDDLQTFNVHVGSAVDAVINVNKWTVRYLNNLAITERESHSLITDLVAKVFAPFQPTVYSDRSLTEKYIELTAVVGARIEDLIEEAQAVRLTLVAAQTQLSEIREFVYRSKGVVRDQQKRGIWELLLELVGANSAHRESIKKQLWLLGKVDSQGNTALVQVTELIHDLRSMQLELKELRDVTAAPMVIDGQSDTGTLTLEHHIEAINSGVERLQSARARIREVEDGRVKEALLRGKEAQRQIESS